ATKTTPRGANEVKLVTRFDTILLRPSPFNKLTGSIIPSGALPAAPSGRGSIAVHPNQSARPLNKITPKAKIANSVTGCGNKFPNHSTKSKKRVKKFFFGFPSG